MTEAVNPERGPDRAADPGSERLARAAAEAFAARGFHGTSTRHVAAAAGMSPAALYVHHRSKEELLHRLSLEGHRRVLALVRDAVAGAEGPVAQLGDLVERFVEHHATEHVSSRVVNYELAALDDEHRAEVAALRHDIEECVRDVVRRGVTEGSFVTDDPDLTAAALISLGVDVSRWFRPGGRWTPAEVAVHYRGLALAMLGVAPPGLPPSPP
ncbi:TetR family transcriptional regulator [Nocardioides sp. CFH 31398]|uniref:TetR family transcriptional regulator n=1 Tax=Nocardioides sp. CFH 31398 TaxID=2919579 RepID=UPI001F05A467|nr:TetR family transcriptional regulator [Nocardioides sp. CFH 31398]MCH1868982.1 TetR family transcriptional regulator [Nocardioides sp. CFH 31398]